MPEILISSEKPEYLKIPRIKADIQTAIEAVLAKLKVKSKLKGKEISVFLCSDEAMQSINNDTRGKNKPTNVLSFPFLGVDVRSADLPKKIADIQIGEIICSIDTMRREAKEQKKLLSHHLIHLFVHSTLHLFGYDHMQEDEADSMEALEVEILKKLGIDNPYI